MHRPLGRWPAQPILVSGVSDLSCVRSEDESGRETLGRPGATVSGRRGRRRRRVIRTNRAVLPWIRPVAPWLLEAFPTGHSIPREYRGIVSIPPTAQSPLLPARPISRPFWNPAKLRRWQAGGLNPNRPPSRFAPRVVHLCHAITTTTTTTTTTIDTPCAVLPARACFCCCRRLPDAARRAAADSACALLATLTPLSLLLSPPYRASAARRPPAPPPACVGCRLSPVLSPIAHRPSPGSSPVARRPVSCHVESGRRSRRCRQKRRAFLPANLGACTSARLHLPRAPRRTFPVRAQSCCVYACWCLLLPGVTRPRCPPASAPLPSARAVPSLLGLLGSPELPRASLFHLASTPTGAHHTPPHAPAYTTASVHVLVLARARACALALALALLPTSLHSTTLRCAAPPPPRGCRIPAVDHGPWRLQCRVH